MKAPKVIVVLVAALGACGEEPKPAPKAEPSASQAPKASEPAPPAASANFTVEIRAPERAAEGDKLALAATVAGVGDRVVRYEWSQLSSQPRVAIPNSYSPNLTLTAPEWTADYDLRLQLRAVAGDKAVIKEVCVHVAADDDAPIAEAFVAERDECGETLLLVGQGHNEVMQGITYEWMQVGDGPRCTIVGVHDSQTTCVLPENAGPYALHFEFHVRDGVNPDAVAKVEVAVDCDPSFAPLDAGVVLPMSAEPGFVQPLPRGRWELAGTLALTPAEAGKSGLAALRFEYGADAAAAVSLSSDGTHASLRRFGLQRDHDGAWSEPPTSGQMPLGEWPAGEPLGFAFGWDGHELAIRWGKPGERDKWPELPFPVDFALSARPKSFALDVSGGTAKVSGLTLSAR